MTTITIAEDGRRLIVSFPYDAGAVATLKDLVPGHSRSYDPAMKRWLVNTAWGEKLTEAMIAAGHEVIGASGQSVVGHGATSTPRSIQKPKRESGVGSFFGIDDSPDFDVDATAAALLEAVPAIYHGKVFRAIAKRLYPDLYQSGARLR